MKDWIASKKTFFLSFSLEHLVHDAAAAVAAVVRAAVVGRVPEGALHGGDGACAEDGRVGGDHESHGGRQGIDDSHFE